MPVCTCRRVALICAFLPVLLCLLLESGFAQNGGGQFNPLALPFPVTTEFSESISPWSADKLVADRYLLATGTKNLRLQFSNQAPGVLGGRQFQGLPGGYQMMEFSLARKWGTVHGFRSTGYSRRMVQPDSARRISGAAVELPKSFLGANLTAFVLRATPAAKAPASPGNPLAASAGSQLGLALTRELKKGTRFQAEWTRTRHTTRAFSAGDRENLARQGLLARLDGKVAGTDLNFAFLSRNEGLANPAVPVYGPAMRTLSMDLRRGFKRHQFQFSTRSDGQRALPLLHMVVRDVFEQSIRWTYTPGRLPQISVLHSRSHQTAATKREMEGTTGLSLSRSFRRVSSSLAYFRGTRLDLQTSRPLWGRVVLSGDANVEIRKDRKIHVRYERNKLVRHLIPQTISSSALQLDTRLSLWTGRLSLSPIADFRRQGGSSPELNVNAIRFMLSAVLQLPRRFPGTDLQVNFGSHHLYTPGHQGQNGAEFSMRWNFKRQ